MPKLKITPSSVLLTSGQSVTFEAADDKGAVPVTWSLNPPTAGILVTEPTPPNLPISPPQPSSSVTYVAPAAATAQRIAVVAIWTDAQSKQIESANATITLTADAIAIVPSKVELGPGQKQQFVAIVAGETRTETAQRIEWLRTPPTGDVDQAGLYTADPTIVDGMVSVYATDRETGNTATATISLKTPVWTGRGVEYLAFYLFLVFTLVLGIALLWPSEAILPADATKNRGDAETALNTKLVNVSHAQSDAADAHDKVAKLTADQGKTADSGSNKTTKPSESESLAKAQADATSADASLQRARDSAKIASDDLSRVRHIELDALGDIAETRLGHIGREVDLFWLVLLAGCLGAFLHMSQSFSDYVGNQTLKSNWAWWYYFRPFVGSGLALTLYVAARGGLLSFLNGPSKGAAESQFNWEASPWTIVGYSALAGMFSRAATRKLGDLFDTLFAKSDKSKDTKDKLADRSPNEPHIASGASAGTATK